MDMSLGKLRELVMDLGIDSLVEQTPYICLTFKDCLDIISFDDHGQHCYLSETIEEIKAQRG